MSGVFNSKQISFLAHTNAREIAYLTACSQPVAKCKQNPTSREEAKPSRSHLCILLTVISCLSSGSSWGQLQSSKFGGRCYLGRGVEVLRQHLSEHFIASNCLSVSSGINPISHCIVPTASSPPNKPTAVNELRATMLHCFCFWERLVIAGQRFEREGIPHGRNKFYNV